MFQRRPFCHNLLLALRPPPPLAHRIAAAAERLGQGSQPWDRLHVTLFIVSGVILVDPEMVAMLRRIGQLAATAPFAVAFDRVIGTDGYVALRPSRRNVELIALHDRLHALARATGLASGEQRRFNPHISLIYRSGRPVNERVAPIGWTADELVLIDSHVGATRHDVLDRWPLVAAPEPQLSLF